MGKDKNWETRKQLASLPFSEKLKLLEKLRDRSRVIAASGLRMVVRRQQEHPIDDVTSKP